MESYSDNLNKKRKLYLYNSARVVWRIPQWNTQHRQLSSLCLVSLSTPCAYDTSTCSQPRRWTEHVDNTQIITLSYGIKIIQLTVVSFKFDVSLCSLVHSFKCPLYNLFQYIIMVGEISFYCNLLCLVQQKEFNHNSQQ